MNLTKIGRRHRIWVNQMGWGDKTVLESLAMIASEMGEAADEIGNAKLGEELADTLLRITDLAGTCEIDLQALLDQDEDRVFLGPSEHDTRDLFLDFMVQYGKWVNTARKQTLGNDFADCMAKIVTTVLIIALTEDINIEHEIERKMLINLERGARGRRI